MSKRYQNIMVAVDGSRQSIKAFAEALDLAKDNEAHLFIVSIINKGFPVTANGYHPAWFVLPDKFMELYSYDYARAAASIKALDKLTEEQNEMEEK